MFFGVLKKFNEEHNFALRLAYSRYQVFFLYTKFSSINWSKFLPLVLFRFQERVLDLEK